MTDATDRPRDSSQFDERASAGLRTPSESEGDARATGSALLFSVVPHFGFWGCVVLLIACLYGAWLGWCVSQIPRDE